MSNTFVTKARLKLAKNQANAKQHSEAGLLLFDENCSNSWCTLLSKNNRAYSKKQAKKQVCLYSWDYTINHNKNKDENEKKSTYIRQK